MIKLDTAMLQDMVSKSVKCAGMNKLIPRTSMLEIRQKDNLLTFMTTDTNNTLYVSKSVSDASEFYAVVYVEQFAKLIQKLTTDAVTLDINDAIMTVKANGTYKIELPLDDEGNVIRFKEQNSKVDKSVDAHKISLATIQTIVDTCKASLAVTLENPCYANYYLSDKVVTSDGTKVCCFDTKFCDKPMLLSPTTIDLLDSFTDDIEMRVADNEVLFTSNDCELYTHVQDDIEEYAIDAIDAFVSEEFTSSCKVSKSALQTLLERIELFVSDYDNHAITLTFTDEGIDVSSMKSSGVESVAYTEKTNVVPYTCQIDVVVLISQIKANKSDTLNIQFGNDKSIKIVDDKITQVIALMESV